MISISERLRPFSHTPGTRCLIPGTSFSVEAFPALLRIHSFDGKVVKEIDLEIDRRLDQFTIFQDLERGCVTVLSELYHIHILPTLEVSFKKHPPLPPFKVVERLSLGSNKKQEWDAIKKRCDFREIFPLWYRLGASLDLPLKNHENLGMFTLITKIKEAIFSHRPETILDHFKSLFLAGFGHMLMPREFDDEHQGILPERLSAGSTPLYLLSEGSALIRSLFMTAEKNECCILPNLPPAFFSGRWMNLALMPYGVVHLEWSKKMIRRLHFEAHSTGEVLFHFSPDVRQFRLRTDLRDKGKIYTCGDSLEIKSGSHYLLDQFQK